MPWGEALDWNYWVHSIVGGAHVIAAIIGLVLGPFIFTRIKGDRVHRISGYVFVLAMLTANITALTLYDLNGGPNLFHALALLSLFSVGSGFYLLQRAVRQKSNKLLEDHARAMMWAYFGLFAAGYAQILSRILPPMLDDFGRAFMIIGVSIGVAGVLCSFLFRMASKRLVLKYPLG